MRKELEFFFMSKVLPPFLYIFLLLLRFTLRVEHFNKSPLDEVPSKGSGSIVCFWHARLLMMPFAKKWDPIKVLISRHRDGEFIARVIRFFNVGTIRGSYRKMSISSLRQIIDNLKAGIDIAITPDGPKGPRYAVKSGIIDLARLSGKTIVPVTYGTGKKKLFTHGTGSSSPALFRKLFSSGENLSLSLVT
jgi:lysophospholipid acyltransferase (LPLAT)-like uncharacterized protein